MPSAARMWVDDIPSAAKAGQKLPLIGAAEAAPFQGERNDDAD
jgi:hypothetical protein